MAKASTNPLFTRSEKRRVRKKIAHKVKGAARAGFARLFGIPLSPGLSAQRPGGKAPRRGHRRSASASQSAGVRGDVLSALFNLGYKRDQAEKMVPSAGSGEGFDSLFRRSVKRNPAELVIFGNPERVYSRKGVLAAKRKGNPIPAGILAGFEGALGSLGAEALMSGKSKRKNRSRGRLRHTSKNPETLSQAKDLFRRFHHRGPSGVYELQRSAKLRKDYTILGPLVAIGTNAEKYDQIRPRENQVVQHWDKLPHMAFLTGPQVEHVRSILRDGDPLKYVKSVALLASSPNGKQLYVISDEKLSIDLGRFDTDATKDYVDLGEATFIVYLAKKPNDPVEWVHVFGEEGGTRPRMGFARLAQDLFFIGGSYRVEAPGIIN